MKTTLNDIREHSPCGAGWQKLLRYLGKTQADDEPLSIVTVLDSNGAEDALWCLRAVPTDHDREIRIFTLWCARQVQHLMVDPRSVAAIGVAERYANGRASEEELDVALTAAMDATLDAGSTSTGIAEGGALVAVHAAALAAYGSFYDADMVIKTASFVIVKATNPGAPDEALGAAWDAAKAAQAAELRRLCAASTP